MFPQKNMNMKDWPVWYFHAKGLFSVKSTYKVAVTRRDAMARCDASTSGDSSGDEGDFNWFRIRQLNVPNKIKMFLWCFAHNSCEKKCGQACD
jgi:hypothetical protein